MIVIRIEGVSTEPCSYGLYFSEPTLFLWGLIIGVAIAIICRFIRERAHG